MDRILIVEDSSVVASLLARWLRDAGYEPTIAASGADGLTAVERDAPSLIILDLILPDVSGIEVCRRLKEQEETTRIPVVILTAAGSSENRLRCLELGAEDFLTKPVVHEELLARVRSLLKAKRLSDRLLLSFMELDKLGTFAETLTSQSIADWSGFEVANTMARHLLGSTPEGGRHPRLAWAGQVVRKRVLGSIWYYESGVWVQETMTVPRERLVDLLRPFDKGGGQFVCKGTVPVELADLLRFPSAVPADNLVAIWRGPNVVMTASYPWEVGAYELPLLRAVMRHWAVFERLRYEARQSEQAFFSTMEALALAAEIHDRETARHIRRVGLYSEIIAKALGFPPSAVKWISRSAQMHDVGKINTPLALLRKSAPLSPSELEIVRRHTVNGAQLLGEMKPLAMARAIARHHHENFDGSGYPDGLAGDEIPVEARIVRIADVYDALRSERPYKPCYSHEQAVTVIRTGDDRVVPAHLDPRVFEAFLDHQAPMAAVWDASQTDEFVAPQRAAAGNNAPQDPE